MSKLKSLSYHELTKKLKKLGFSGPYVVVNIYT